MSFNVGRKPKITEIMEKNGYSYIKQSELKEQVLIESIIKGSGVDEDGVESEYIAIAGQGMSTKNKIWFYTPAVDNAELIDASSEELEMIADSGEYYYIIEQTPRKTPVKGKSNYYSVGTLEKL